MADIEPTEKFASLVPLFERQGPFSPSNFEEVPAEETLELLAEVCSVSYFDDGSCLVLALAFIVCLIRFVFSISSSCSLCSSRFLCRNESCLLAQVVSAVRH